MNKQTAEEAKNELEKCIHTHMIIKPSKLETIIYKQRPVSFKKNQKTKQTKKSFPKYP